MKIKKFTTRDTYEIAALMYNQLEEDDEASFGVVGSFDMISALVKDFMQVDEECKYTIASLNIGDYETEGYEGPYHFTVAIGKIWCDKFYMDSGKPYMFDEEYVLAEKDLLAKIMECNMNGDPTYFVFDEDEDSGFNLIANADDDGVHGIAYSKEGDDYCLNMKICFCEDKDPDGLISMFDDVLEKIAKWIVLLRD